jgi:S-adenosylmethionine:tRNA ribosyltransferase-isomerase
LCWNQGDITDAHFTNLPRLLPEHTTLVLNQSRVIPARLHFTKATGGVIEVFCLEPDAQYGGVEAALTQQGSVDWHCMVGGASKWKTGQVLTLENAGVSLQAVALTRQGGEFLIRFQWSEVNWAFAAVLELFGAIPLPPYMNRAPQGDDRERYQTVFAQTSGSVAAPTASLHFSDLLLQQLTDTGVRLAHTLLHVGAGTFQPVKAATMEDHPMHSEWIEIDAPLVEALLKGLSGTIVAVGTTALRTIESLYWIGCKLAQHLPVDWSSNAVTQWEPYDALYAEVPVEDALNALLGYLRKTAAPIRTRTQILIAPGYPFKIARGLITNFHQPRSTLLLLVAAFAGPGWRQIYEHALSHDYRFLSYGDGSLLWR